MWVWVERRYGHLASRPLLAAVPTFLADLLIPFSAWFLLLAVPSFLLCRRWMLLAVALLLLGLVRGHFAVRPPDPLPSGEYTFRGRVVNTPTLAQRSQRFVLDVGDRRILVYARAERLLVAGDWVEVSGQLERIVHYSDQGPFNRQAHWERRGINQQISAAWGGALEVVEPGSGLATLGSAWRNASWERLRRHLPRRYAGVTMGILAGQQSLVDEDVKENMRRSGTMHLLATSGFNVFLVALGLMWLLSHLPIPRSAQVAVVILLLIAYAGAVGGRPSVIRAAIMASLFLSAYLFRRSPDGLSALAAAAILFLLVEPGAIWDVGFQMSFLAVLAILLFVPQGFRWMRGVLERKVQNKGVRLALNWAGTLLLTTVVAQLGSAPLTAHYFGIVSLIAPISNLMTATAVPFIYIGAMSAQVAGLVWEPLSLGLDLMITGPFAAWIDWVNARLGSPGWAALEFNPVSVWWVGAYYAGLILLSRPDRVSAEGPVLTSA
ncbi:MAG: ComEC/Rec2 family competence protein [Armatimonadetes bacterium]|nr:ComEC/Rec2 family competence protein [Armatimonadota bacterium]